MSNRGGRWTTDQFILLMVLAVNPGRMGKELHELARAAGCRLAQKSTYNTLANLERLGWVTSKQGRSAEGRPTWNRMNYWLTAEGMLLLRERLRHLRICIDAHGDEVERLAAALEPFYRRAGIDAAPAVTSAGVESPQ